jgi:ankyrin repeat protein
VEYLLSHGEAVMKSGPYYDEEVLRSQDVGAFKITDINRACGTDMRTPLLEAVRWNRPNLVHLLFERGADSTAVSKNPFSGQSSTWTALHVLAYGGLDDTQLVQTLIDHGAPVEGLPQHFHTTESPLLVAVQTDSFRISDCLISHGADINFATISSGHLTLTYPTTILGHVVASNARNSIARIRYLFGTASPKNSIRFVVEPARQWTCLHRAAAAHIDTMFRATDATEEVELDWTDVDWGANREMLNELLGQFGDAKQLDAAEQSSGLTAMHLAVLAGNEAAVNLLIEYGAHSDVPNIVGETAAGLALRIHMEGLAINGESVQLGEKEVAARNKCNDLLNPSTRPIV